MDLKQFFPITEGDWKKDIINEATKKVNQYVTGSKPVVKTEDIKISTQPQPQKSFIDEIINFAKENPYLIIGVVSVIILLKGRR
mgnify:CR=1 FL=1